MNGPCTTIRQYRDRDQDLQDKDDAELEAAREADSFSFGLRHKFTNTRLESAMSKISYGGPCEIPPVMEVVPNDEMENDIRRWGVVTMCEWFGHAADSEFTAQTIALLRERSESGISSPI